MEVVISFSPFFKYFIGGKVNGYYDSQKNTIADWTNIINNAPYQDIDVTNSLEGCPNAS